MKFERGKGIKASAGIGIKATYNPIYVKKAFKLKYRLKGREGQITQSLFGPERGHDVLRVLEADHPDREKLQELTCIQTPIVELYEIRFSYDPKENDGKYVYGVELPYELGYVYDVDAWMREIVRKHGDISKLPFRTEETHDLPVMFDGNLYFIKVISFLF